MSGSWEPAAVPPAVALRLWWVWARAVAVVGAVGTVIVWSLGRALLLTAMAMAMSMAVGLLVDARDVGKAVRIGVVAAGLVLGCAGVLAALGWSGLVLVAPLAVVGWWLRTAPAPSRAADELVPTEGTWTSLERLQAEGLRDLTDVELCTAWRRSFAALAESPVTRRTVVVRARQLYLDEIERRHPLELKQWLASGARAAGNPLPFLSRRRRSDAEPLRESSDPPSPDDRS